MHDSTQQQRQQPPSSPVVPLSSSTSTPPRPLPPWPVSPQERTTDVDSPRAHERRECPGAPTKQRRRTRADGSNLGVRPRRLFLDDTGGFGDDWRDHRSNAGERTAYSSSHRSTASSNGEDDHDDDGNRHFCHYAIESPPPSPCVFRRLTPLMPMVTPMVTPTVPPAATVSIPSTTTPIPAPNNATGRIIGSHRTERGLEQARGASLSLTPGRGLFTGRTRSVSTNSNDNDNDNDLQEMNEQP
mmetsp:Transcript_3679/g.8208  ORF Transcript_3679/g.8208 Transcript_3679/m.8208 type:complete len:243 (-) Transcript_3679:1882-2610(-)|eukprot:CAMPEP_0168200302 /NCGR_PEP_ID=MMETSP0139_2-20121125/22968_1 /TAXON_ID=44445 /ORGANISM="Pseudo-nitzschia australis, Strain 10249 10 AB" /LENGTH=242 /DNA_ID=CAMNT_0008125517 /DNA_START=396 /DNA_END=1124 /DNA_ORIENTATION=+